MVEKEVKKASNKGLVIALVALSVIIIGLIIGIIIINAPQEETPPAPEYDYNTASTDFLNTYVEAGAEAAIEEYQKYIDATTDENEKIILLYNRISKLDYYCGTDCKEHIQNDISAAFNINEESSVFFGVCKFIQLYDDINRYPLCSAEEAEELP